MDAPYYNGSDDRDVFDPEPEPDCRDCGAGPEEPCTPECGCRYCINRRARLAAQRHFEPEPAA